MTDRPLLVGAEATNPRSITIWSAIRDYFLANDFPMEYVLYSTYDAMDQALLRGDLDVAWNAPMAHAQCLIQSDGACRTLAMRDVDEAVTSLIITRPETGIEDLEGLRGRSIALGVEVSSELRLLPVHELKQAGFDLEKDAQVVDLAPQTYPGGKAWVNDGMIFEEVQAGQVDAGVIFAPYLPRLLEHYELDESAVRVVWQSTPFDHCAFTGRAALPESVGDRFVELLLAMDPSDPDIAEMMTLEGMRTRWLPAKTEGWNALVDAVKSVDLVGATF